MANVVSVVPSSFADVRARLEAIKAADQDDIVRAINIDSLLHKHKGYLGAPSRGADFAVATDAFNLMPLSGLEDCLQQLILDDALQLLFVLSVCPEGASFAQRLFASVCAPDAVGIGSRNLPGKRRLHHEAEVNHVLKRVGVDVVSRQVVATNRYSRTVLFNALPPALPDVVAYDYCVLSRRTCEIDGMIFPVERSPGRFRIPDLDLEFFDHEAAAHLKSSRQAYRRIAQHYVSGARLGRFGLGLPPAGTAVIRQLRPNGKVASTATAGIEWRSASSVEPVVNQALPAMAEAGVELFSGAEARDERADPRSTSLAWSCLPIRAEGEVARLTAAMVWAADSRRRP